MLAASKALGMFRKYIVMSFRRRALEHGPMDGLHLYCLTRRRAFVIFSAYYDESGTHADSPVTVLAGLIGPVDDWVPFERDWRMVLKKHNLTHVRGKHLYHRQKQHKGWTDKQVTLLWADILYALQERKGFVITQTVLNNREYLSSYVRDGSIGKERLDTKYALCLRACLNFHPVVHEQAYATGCVDLVLESGHRNAGDATRVFNEMKAPWAKSLGTISYGSKQDFPALQAADLIAYWLYKTENKRLDWTGVDKLELSPLAHELVRCGLSVVTHSITKSDLIALRRNEPSQPAFRKVKIAAKADHFEGDWNDPNFIIFADLSVDRAEQRRLRSQDQSSRRKRRP